VNCTTNQKDSTGKIVSFKQSFLGYMLYNRWWFHHDRYGLTIGGGKINNPWALSGVAATYQRSDGYFGNSIFH